MIIGQSRGGVFAKALGARRPDLVAGVVTLGSPVRSQLAVHPLVLAQVGVVAALGTAAAARACSPSRCLRGDCCARFRDALAGPFPPEVGYVALYSRSDGIVDWRSCLDPPADELRRGPRLALRHGRERRTPTARSPRALARVRRAPTTRWAQAA